ncbi:NTP transferase domain-containing protein [Qipengyuania atrilutea]|uniref:NTP transferase domain-containing protein n=1 Tax=Qipengyuania atrilutea TaxID=2744473 RepID=A0A850H4J8_9SPHN|nr:NTP transferase domain-containing protein [Actirhodobacter atriluteus]NVD45540.1 NTP transferase domain-containing protein [Actirhodobacter atriluteus]
MQQVTALVLAGKRSGALDPLAANADVAQKCVVPIYGKPLIEHVVHALSLSPRIAEIRVVAHEPDEIAAIPLVAKLRRGGRLSFREAQFNLVDSAKSGANGALFPILLTTADNVLVTSAGYEEFIEKALAEEAGAAAALARKEDVQKADPEGQKRFYEFRDGSYSNCNMYWIGSQGALSAAEVFRGGGQFVKFPKRIAKAFGVTNLIRFYFGWGTKEDIFAQISKRFGYKMVPIVMSDGQFAVDVDNQRTYDVAGRLLARRDGLGEAAPSATDS